MTPQATQSHPASKVLLVAAAEASLKTHGQVELRLDGSCMWPILRNGDVITIKKASRDEIGLGDVAAFKLSEQSLHVNTQFTRHPRMSPDDTREFLGRVTQFKRGNQITDLDKRSMLKKLVQVLISPANPYLLGLPQTLFRKLKKLSTN